MEFNFYFAGSMNNECEYFKYKVNANILKSWFLDLSSLKKTINMKKEGKYQGKILVDSGAFTAHRKDININCEDYINFLKPKNYLHHLVCHHHQYFYHHQEYLYQTQEVLF